MKFDEFREGESWVTAEREVTAEEIIAFATVYDPQPVHTDPEAARVGPFGRVIASGFQTMALAWSLWVELGVMGSDGEAGVSLDDARWYAPVVAGDRLHAEVKIGSARLTRKGRGLLRMDFTLRRQDGTTVLTFTTNGIVARAGDAEA